MTFIFTSNFSVPFYSCLNRTKPSHILYKHMDTEDIWIISSASRNNLTYSFLLEKASFLSCLLLSWMKHLFFTFHQRYFSVFFGYFLFNPRFFFWPSFSYIAFFKSVNMEKATGQWVQRPPALPRIYQVAKGKSFTTSEPQFLIVGLSGWTPKPLPFLTFCF